VNRADEGTPLARDSVATAKSFLQWLKPGRRDPGYVGVKSPTPLNGSERRPSLYPLEAWGKQDELGPTH